ncbi:TrgA family protein [Tateyamaria omphalii]|uniref:Tellurium resistance protein n=1 Tax=Tateyamaria omphalii TaxID=299262 RepID=A0A1P8MTL5_9RHOB|nr:TrgA family protein [Tateyamaria omphalii]APX11426.1 tellurium resistance protein [Tateyamaria omphalii]
MPDAAKLVGGVCLAILAFVVSGMIMPLFEEDTNFGWFTHVNVAVGFICGWMVIGARAGRGMTSAINVGLTGPVVMVFWALFIQSCNEMVRVAMKNRYDGAFEAVVAIFQIGAEWALLMATIPIWVTLLAGGAITGVLTEYAWRTWR